MLETTNERLIEANVEALRFFQSLLGTTGSWPGDYLAERRLDRLVEADPRWQVGYAPDSWSALVDHLRRERYTDEEMLEAGLAAATNRGYLVDRFRDRLMFPIRDLSGRPVGFTGRARHAVPKYMNTRTTPIYRKSEMLYGLGEQRAELEAGAIPVFVEGPADVMAIRSLALSGRQRWVGLGTCGTVLTAEHRDLVRSVATADVAIAGFDADLGGRIASRRAFPLLTARFSDVRGTELPNGQDPSSLYSLDRGDDALAGMLGWCRPLASLVIDDEIRRWEPVLDHISGKINALRAVAPIVAKLPGDQVAFEAARLTRILALDHDLVTYELTEGIRKPERRPRPRRPPAAGPDGGPAADPPIGQSLIG